MQIHGFIKTTLLDYPQHVAATIFTGGCNFRCPYCHNSDLILQSDSSPVIAENEILSHLKKRSGILDGVCISGGEPTLNLDLEDFIRRIRALGFKVKLDTNGYFPDVLIRLCEQKLLDYVAMDIKHTPDKYHLVCNMDAFDLSRILESVDFLKSGLISYEFRTTLVTELHHTDDISVIGEWLRGADAYYLQPYRESEHILIKNSLLGQKYAVLFPNGFHAPDHKTLTAYVNLLKNRIPNVAIRGES